MRISGWSSDVCSSDLFDLRASALAVLGSPAAVPRRRPVSGGATEADRRPDRPLAADRLHVPDLLGFCRPAPVLPAQPARRAVHPGLVRKSVVSGKSVSGRVDLGGRRFIKKKKA